MGSSATKYVGIYPQDNESFKVSLKPKDNTFKCIMKLGDQVITATGKYVTSEDKSGYDLQTTRLHIAKPQKITLILADEGATKSSLGNGSYFTPSENLLWFAKNNGTTEAGKQEVVLRYRIPTFKVNGNNVQCDEGPWNTASIYGKSS